MNVFVPKRNAAALSQHDAGQQHGKFPIDTHSSSHSLALNIRPPLETERYILMYRCQRAESFA